jgi:CDP-4-dehydro-6-deoxyglucose reductase, E3
VSTSFRIAIEGGPSFDCGAGENLVSAAERAGWALPASCRAGICGSCEGDVDEGAFVLPARQDDGAVLAAPMRAAKLCRVKPRSDLRITPREFAPVDEKARKPLVAKVLRIDKPSAEVAVLKLRLAAGVRAKFRAGQYLQVLLPDGQERCFSMANPPHSNDGVELHVRWLPGGAFAERVFNALKPGDTVSLRLPLGDFYIRESERPIVFLAGGTGFAPVQSMVEDLMRRGSARPVSLYFGARTPELLYRESLVAQWRAKKPDLRYVPVVSSPGEADRWEGRRGLVHEAVLQDLGSLAGHEVYACGAPGMIEAAREAFVRSGLEREHFHCDAFVPSAERGV